MGWDGMCASLSCVCASYDGWDDHQSKKIQERQKRKRNENEKQNHVVVELELLDVVMRGGG